MENLLVLFWMGGASLVGLMLVVVACFLTRRWAWLLGAFCGAMLLHLVTASCIASGGPFYSEPSAADMARYHEDAVFVFFVGLPFLGLPLVAKLIYEDGHSSKKAANPPSNDAS